jgi:flagellar hook-associated protein 1 FlgK
MQRDNGAVALITTGGAMLLDGRAAQVSFKQANMIDAQTTVENGALSGLNINGVPIPTDAEFGAVTGGTLGASFRIRDVLGPQAQASLDAFAQDLITRFQSGSLASGQTGLFTDDGQPLSASVQPGLAGRIALDARADPAQGGATWRLRDGLDATAPGPPGDASRINAMIDALQTRRGPPAAMPGAADGTAADLAAELVAGIGAARHRAESEQSFAAARQEAVKAQLLEQGVDTDAQMQRLLQIEQSYSANARVLQALDEMMQTLTRL